MADELNTIRTTELQILDTSQVVDILVNSADDDGSIGYQGESNEYLEIGGIAQSSAHYFSCGKINLFRSYILTDDELFWGVKYG